MRISSAGRVASDSDVDTSDQEWHWVGAVRILHRFEKRSHDVERLVDAGHSMVSTPSWIE
jgi:hypothetical protein